VDRRTFLKLGSVGMGTLAAAGSALTEAEAAQASPKDGSAPVDVPTGPLTDVNVYVSHWPFRRVPGDETPELVSRLRSRGVAQAWAGNLDAMLHRDFAAVNTRLAQECKKNGEGILIPFGAINPKQPDWEDDVRRCQEVHGMPGIRLHPNYHSYDLNDPDFLKLLDLATSRKLVVQIAMTMEDERSQHPVCQVPHVTAGRLAEQLKQRPELHVVMLNAFRGSGGGSSGELGRLKNVWWEISMVEAVGGVKRLAERLGTDRVLFGSYAPVFIFESALFKLQESPLSESELRAITVDNAKKVLSVG
jgi:predicted TIM-barrel fold metal-dependent hydrolase